MKKFKIISTTLLAMMMLISVAACQSESNTSEEEESTVVVTETSEEEVCDGVIVRATEDERFLDAYNLVSGSWISEDGNMMFHIYKDNDLYYIHMDGYDSEGHRYRIPRYNMYNIAVNGNGNERTVYFQCNADEGQYQNEFIIQQDGEYIKYTDYSSEHNEFYFYPYDREDISVEAIIFVNLNMQRLDEYVPTYDLMTDNYLNNLNNLPEEVLANFDFEGKIMDVSTDVLREDAEIIASVDYIGELGMAIVEVDDTTITYTACSSRYGAESMLITFSLDDYHIMRIESESGVVLYESYIP